MFATLYEVEDSQRLAEHKFTELPFELQELALTLDLSRPEMVNRVEVQRQRDDRNAFVIEFKFEFSYEDWKGPFSFAEYANALHEAFEEAEVENLVGARRTLSERFFAEIPGTIA